MNLPTDYPYKERKVGFECACRYRHTRIDEVLSSLPHISIEDSMQLQNDVLSLAARRLIAVLRPLRSDDADTKAALDLLKGWNAILDGDSPQAALHEVWLSRHLRAAFKHAVLSKSAAASFDVPDASAMLETLALPQSRFAANATELRDHLLLTTLAAAYREMQTLHGTDSKQWKCGNLPHNLTTPPFSPLAHEAIPTHTIL